MKRILLYSLFLFLIAVLIFFSSCKKESNKPELTPVPFLTGRLWVADTLELTPPVLISQLSTTEKQNFLVANNFFKMAGLQLNENGTVIQGDWDFGYSSWKLINNDRDIEMKKNDGTTEVLRNWSATTTRFSYTSGFGVYEVNNVYK
jgi:hypothetical protein